MGLSIIDQAETVFIRVGVLQTLLGIGQADAGRIATFGGLERQDGIFYFEGKLFIPELDGN